MKNAKESRGGVCDFDMLWGGFLKICHGSSEISNRGIYSGVYRGDLTWRVLNFIS